MKGTDFYTKDLCAHEIQKGLLIVGDYTYGKPKIMEWGEGKKLVVGKYCSIAENVTIFLGGNHRTDWITTYPFPKIEVDWPEARGILGHPWSKGDVVIGNDVWIGYGASILSGVKVGDGAVIGAYAVVANDVPAYAIVVGNPGRIVKYRFGFIRRYYLHKLEWWDWDETVVAGSVTKLCTKDVDSLIKEYLSSKFTRVMRRLGIEK